MTWTIYKLTGAAAGTGYIGITTNLAQRLRIHGNLLFKGLVFCVETLAEVPTKGEALALEGELITKHATAAPFGLNRRFRGCATPEEQRRKIGEANRGKVRTPEQRYSSGNGKRGKPLSAEHKANIAAATKGHATSAETREKISQAHRGKKLSPEHIAKLAALRRGKKRPPGAGQKTGESLRRSYASAAGDDHREAVRKAQIARFAHPEERAHLSRKMKAWWEGKKAANAASAAAALPPAEPLPQP